MKLYDAKTAPNCRRVRIFLAEKGVEVPMVEVDIVKADNRKPPYVDKNPMGTLPMLELDDGTCIAESVAICRYFEELHPDPPLMGVGATDRALVEMWNRRMELELAIPVMSIFRHSHDFWKGRLEQVPEWGEVSRRHAMKMFEWVDRELAEREFITGNNFTIADITALVGIDFARVSRIRLEELELPNLKRWHAAVAARPSAGA